MACKKCNKKSKASKVLVDTNLSDILNDNQGDKQMSNQDLKVKRFNENLENRWKNIEVEDLPIFKRLQFLIDNHPEPQKIKDQLKKILEDTELSI